MGFRGTPGPWKHRGPLGEIYSDGCGVIADLMVNGKEEENGALMAAAPELLEALQGLVKIIDVAGWEHVTVGARAAIAKALGEE